MNFCLKVTLLGFTLNRDKGFPEVSIQMHVYTRPTVCMYSTMDVEHTIISSTVINRGICQRFPKGCPCFCSQSPFQVLLFTIFFFFLLPDTVSPSCSSSHLLSPESQGRPAILRGDWLMGIHSRSPCSQGRHYSAANFTACVPGGTKKNDLKE